MEERGKDVLMPMTAEQQNICCRMMGMIQMKSMGRGMLSMRYVYYAQSERQRDRETDTATATETDRNRKRAQTGKNTNSWILAGLASISVYMQQINVEPVGDVVMYTFLQHRICHRLLQRVPLLVAAVAQRRGEKMQQLSLQGQV